ncbi:MAG: hypothetical protein ACHQW9_00090 [Nitrososphaerales archaeon]
MSIPLNCPNCNGKLVLVFYEVLLNILKKRSWHVCQNCDFERDAEKYKREMCRA